MIKRYPLIRILLFMTAFSLSQGMAQPAPSLPKQSFEAIFDRGRFWSEGSSPIDGNTDAEVDVIDAHGNAFLGNLFSVGPRFFLGVRIESELIYISVGTATSKEALISENPGWASRTVYLDNGLETYLTPLDGAKSRRVFKLTAMILDELHLPALKQVSAEHRFWMESYKMSVEEVKALTGTRFTFVPKTLRSNGVFPIHFNYFGFKEVTLEKVYEYGGFLGIRARSDRKFSTPDERGYENERFDFHVDLTIDSHTGAPFIKLSGYRSSRIRAPWLITDFISLDSDSLILTAEKRPKLLWKSSQTARFCRGAVSSTGSNHAVNPVFGPPV